MARLSHLFRPVRTHPSQLSPQQLLRRMLAHLEHRLARRLPSPRRHHRLVPRPNGTSRLAISNAETHPRAPRPSIRSDRGNITEERARSAEILPLDSMDILSVRAIGLLNLVLVLALGTTQTVLVRNPVTSLEEVLMDPSDMDLAKIFQEEN